MSLLIQHISLYHFKNYEQREFSFPQRITGICGRNGVGKTNLLDAIYYLCFTRSYFSRQDVLNTTHGEKGFRLEGRFQLYDHPEQAVCILRENGRKEFLLNGEAYTKFSAHLGRYPVVMIAPDDIQMITGASEDRRKFIDTLISQIDANYLQALINYTRILQQRNSFLRHQEDSFRRDLSVLDVLDSQLAKEAHIIFEARRAFCLRFLPWVRQLYQDIARQKEELLLIYESELHQQSMEQLLENNRQRDLTLQRTSSGIHRDDLDFRMGDYPFRATASQGQRKSLLFALKLAELQVLNQEKKRAPILLLDDVFEKLDETRISNLLEQVTRETESQILLTDTSCSRLETHFQRLGTDYSIIELE